MGCATSKVDDLPAVALCRGRCAFLDEAIRQRYALAEAHVAYTRSLAAVAGSLRHFIEHSGGGGGADLGHISPPALDLPPPKNKGGGDAEAVGSAAPAEQAIVKDDSVSDSSSHLNFHSDDDSSSSLHAHSGHIEYISTDHDESGFSSYHQGGILHMNYMKNRAAPSHVVYEQRLPTMSEETVRYFGEPEKSSLYYPYPYYEPNMYPNSGGSSYLYPGYSSPAPNYGSLTSGASSSKPPPAPPSPPRASAWDFLNPFESIDNKFHSQYSSSSRDSRELREEEGIPDLEDESDETVMEVDGGHRKSGEVGLRKYVDVVADDAVDSKVQGESSTCEPKPSAVSVDSDPVEYEVHVVEKLVHSSEPRSSNGGPSGVESKVFGSVSEVVREIEVQFESASQSGDEIAKMLEVGKLPYHRKHQVASKLMHMVSPLSMVSSEPSTSGTEPPASIEGARPAHLAFEEEVGMKSGNLSSTLLKLYLWEKKLYNEVKAEEKMSVVHDRKVKKLKRLDETGAEPHKIDPVRSTVRSLSTKIMMAIQVVDKISVTITKIRDEELWPQLHELIQGLSRMWKSMLECHHNQCRAIRQVKSFDPIGPGKKLGDAHIDATLQFERELLYWTERFSAWVSAQKGFIRALNNWLLKCLLYEPEETPDGIVPFSPGRMGAPPVFVICNQWSQALEEIPEMEVINSLHVFATSVFQRWERDKLDMQQMIVADKDLDQKVRDEDQKIQKEIQALEKKMVLVLGEGGTLSASGRLVYQSDVSGYNFQASLRRIFEAMESFTEQSLRVYVELLQRSGEQASSDAREN